jgi:hypothetical protein
MTERKRAVMAIMAGCNRMLIRCMRHSGAN